MSTVPKKRRVVPYAQGDLDYMCAIYAIINAFRALCPEIDDDVSTRMFRMLIRAMDRNTKHLVLHLSLGTDSTLFAKLLVATQAYAKRQLKIDITIEQRGKALKSQSLEAAWKALAAHIDEHTVLILPLEGLCNHWTVLYDVKPRKLRLIDSGYRRHIKRSTASLKRSKDRYQLKLSGVIALSRTSGHSQKVRLA